LEIAL